MRKYNKRINLTKLGEQNSEELSRYAQDEMVYWKRELNNEKNNNINISVL